MSWRPVKLVNGDHRIGVFARKSALICAEQGRAADAYAVLTGKRIPAGAELFLDYGSEFHFN